MAKCTFCEIITSKSKAAFILSTRSAIAFLDKYPVVEGHCLVVPKRHYAALWKMPKSELLGLMELVAKVQKRISANLNVEGADLRQHYRPFLEENEMVKRHVHFHVIPRTYNDAIYQKSLKHHEKLRTKPTLKQLRKTALKISTNLK